MSFYGQVLYEFSKLFSQLKTKNSTSEDVFAAGSNDPIAPSEQWDSLNIEGANKWIQINSTQNNKTIKIGHGEPGATDEAKTIYGFYPVASIPPDITPEVLPAGTVIKTTINECDAAGHTKDATESYFVLPINETEQDLLSITERVQSLEDSYVANDQFNGLITAYVQNSEDFKTEMANYLSENEYLHGRDLDKENNESFVTTKLTGTLDEMYPEGETYSLAQTVGIMSGEDSFVDNLEKTFTTPYSPKETYTISEAINVLSQAINSLQADVQGVKISHSELLILTHDLRTRMDELEAELNKLKTPTE